MSKRRLTCTDRSHCGKATHMTKLYRVAELDEWQVEFYVDGVLIGGATYHTNNEQDAEETIDSYHNHY